MSKSSRLPPSPAVLVVENPRSKQTQADQKRRQFSRFGIVAAIGTAVAAFAIWPTPTLAFFNNNSGAITAVATLFIAGFTYTLWRTTQGTLTHLEREFIATHRPKLHVRNVVVRGFKGTGNWTGVPFAPGHSVFGQLYVVNMGDTGATITESGCWVVWNKHPLPMERPYEGKTGNGLIASQTRLEPGESIPGCFMSEKRLEQTDSSLWLGDRTMHLWVMGWIEYRDDRDTPRRTTFCRQYHVGPGGSPEFGHFEAVKNPDYEHEE